MKILLLCLLSTLALANTVTIPLQVTVTPTGTTVAIAGQTTTVPMPAAPQPPTTAGWGFHNSTWSWAGDFNNQAVANYAAPGGLSGANAISITLKAAWGEWLPYMSPTFVYPTTGYTKLTLALKPTQAGQKWSLYFVGIGDVNLHCGVDVLRYGAPPVAGVWATYTVPLADLCVLGKPVYKFGLQDKTGKSANVWYVDNAGFIP